MTFNKIIKLNYKKIQKGRCFVVSEISANHSGNFSKLKLLIDKLSKAGVDAIKIQAYEAKTITIESSRKDFKISNKNAWAKYKTLYELYKKAETPFSWYKKIFDYCKKKKIIIFASVFDKSSLDLLEKLKCPAYKIASPEITDIPLISAVAKTKKPIIISNGLANIKDLNLAVKTVKKEKNKNLILLQCTSSYPTPLNEVNLKTMTALEIKYKCLSGFSDHTLGTATSIHAASIGACMIEKHVGLKKNNSVDSFFSINDTEFKEMIKIIRQNEISSGKINFNISQSSKKNLNGRRSLYITENIKKGQKFSEKNIRSIRPSFGIHPKFLNNFLKKYSNKNLKKGTRLSWKYIKKN